MPSTHRKSVSRRTRSSPNRSPSRSRSPVRRTRSAPKAKSTRKLTPWNLALKAACLSIRKRHPEVKGPELFKQAAPLAKELLAAGRF